MNYTKHYQLNQWDAVDRVLREDFNADNQKVDAALAEIKAQPCFTKLAETVTTESVHTLLYDLPSIDWANWQIVRIDLRLINGNGGNGEVSLNGGGRYTSIMGGSSSTPFFITTLQTEAAPETRAPGRIFLLPMGEPDTDVRAVSIGAYGFCYSRPSYRWPQKAVPSVLAAALRCGGCGKTDKKTGPSDVSPKGLFINSLI